MLIPSRPAQTGGRTSTDVADAAVAAWARIDRQLAPTVGRRGVAALFRRSVHIAQADRPWLAPVFEATAGEGTEAVEALRAALAARDADVAAAASSQILAIFRDLLAGLVGENLAQLLLPPDTDTTGDDPPKDSAP